MRPPSVASQDAPLLQNVTSGSSNSEAAAIRVEGRLLQTSGRNPFAQNLDLEVVAAVLTLIGQRYEPTLSLALTTLAFAVSIAVTLGFTSLAGHWVDYFAIILGILIVAAIILGMGRAVGETMAVIMVAGNALTMPTSLLQPVRTLTSNIALEMGYATGEHRQALFATGVVLFVATMALNFLASLAAKVNLGENAGPSSIILRGGTSGLGIMLWVDDSTGAPILQSTIMPALP